MWNGSAPQAPRARTAPGTPGRTNTPIAPTCTVGLGDAKVVIEIQHATPSDGSDDFEPTPMEANGFNVGDKDMDDRLGPVKTWLYTAMSTVTEGEHANVGTAVGVPVNPDGVTDADAAHYLNVVPMAAHAAALEQCEDITAGELQFNHKKASIQLTNSGDTDLTIENILLNWSAVNGNLKKIKLGRRTIYRERTAPSTAMIDEFNGSSSSRTIVAGETLTLSLKFPRTA